MALSAILAADVVGYSRLMEQDEAGTFERLRAHRRELFEPSMDHYCKGEYRDARAVALKINLPENHMAQAGLAAVYGQLGETEKAKATIDHILTYHPKFAEDPRAAFVRRRMPRELVESLMDGLRKAGLEVAPGSR